MIIIPAIDIKNGKCVRLTQGDFDKEKIYEEDPVAMAKQFEKDGADLIHIVDLDGAQTGIMKNKSVIQQVAKAVKIPIQIGGGIRSRRLVYETLSFASRVVLGTEAIENPKFLREVIKEFEDKIVVSLDAKNGKLTTKGWVKTTDIDALEYAKELEELRVETFIYTDIARDGTLTSPNFSSIEQLRKVIKGFLIASGGVSSLDDIKKLKELGADGVIIGKALYEEKIDLREAIQSCHSELDSESNSTMKGGDAEINSA